MAGGKQKRRLAAPFGLRAARRARHLFVQRQRQEFDEARVGWAERHEAQEHRDTRTGLPASAQPTRAG